MATRIKNGRPFSFVFDKTDRRDCRNGPVIELGGYLPMFNGGVFLITTVKHRSIIKNGVLIVIFEKLFSNGVSLSLIL